MRTPTTVACGALALALLALPACAGRRDRRVAEAGWNAAAAAEANPEVLSDDEMKARGITPPVITRAIAPIYPQKARLVDLEGSVILAVKILENGRAVGARILQSTSPLFDEPAVACVKRWRFEPATQDGKPVAVWCQATVRFTIR